MKSGPWQPPCFSEEIRRNISLRLGSCAAGGRHALRYALTAGAYNCRAFSGDALDVPATAAHGACTLRCKGGERLAMPQGDVEAAGGLAKPACVKCPANHFSLGGGELIRDWGSVLSGPLEEPRSPQGSRPGVGSPPRVAGAALPPQFETVCYGFNDTAFQALPCFTLWKPSSLVQPKRIPDHVERLTCFSASAKKFGRN